MSGEADAKPKYPQLRSCCLAHLKWLCSFAVGLVCCGLAALAPKELTEHLIVDAEVAGFLTGGGVVFVGWSAVEFSAWRKKRRAAKRAAQQ